MAPKGSQATNKKQDEVLHKKLTKERALKDISSASKCELEESSERLSTLKVVMTNN